MAQIMPAVQLAAHAKSSTLYGPSYGVKFKFFRLDELPLFRIIMRLRCARCELCYYLYCTIYKYKLSPLRIKLKKISEREKLKDANCELERNNSRNVLRGCRLKLRDFIINYIVRAWLVPIQAKVKVGPALYLIRTHGDPSYHIP